jgi:hypothetical protein
MEEIRSGRELKIDYIEIDYIECSTNFTPPAQPEVA